MELKGQSQQTCKVCMNKANTEQEKWPRNSLKSTFRSVKMGICLVEFFEDYHSKISEYA